MGLQGGCFIYHIIAQFGTPCKLQEVSVHDVTSMYTAVNVLGPASRELLQSLTDAPLDILHFPSFRFVFGPVDEYSVFQFPDVNRSKSGMRLVFGRLV